MVGWRSIAVVVTACCAGAFVLADAMRDPWRLPATQSEDWPAWDPEQRLTFTFHDRRRDDIITGRFVTIEVAMGHTDWGGGFNWGSPNGGSSRFISLHHDAIVEPDGSVSMLPGETSPDRRPSPATTPPGFTVTLSTTDAPDHSIYEKLMIQAKQFNPPFSGEYRAGFPLFDTGKPEEVHYIGEHCGFDMFESAVNRVWHQRPPPLDLTRPPPPEVAYPFDRARLFGWPNEDGVTYEFALICDDRSLCGLDAPPRPWLNASYFFRRQWLCDVPKVVHAHQAWLEDHIVAEETETLNPVFRGSPL
jgi:hypothetical protein